MSVNIEAILAALDLAGPEWTVAQVIAVAEGFVRWHNIGVYKGANHARAWGVEANASGSNVEKCYHNLAKAIERLRLGE